MCLVCVTVAGTLIATSQFTPVDVLSTPPVFQKTLTAFSASSTTLSSRQKSEIESLVEQHPEAEKFICTGIRFESAPVSQNLVVRKRAKAACDYAKQLNPRLSTWFQNKPTKARDFAGRVILTLKVGNETATSRPVTGSSLPREGTACTEIAQKVFGSGGFMKCVWQGGPVIQDFREQMFWRFYPEVRIQTSQSNNYQRGPVAGNACQGSGDTFNVSGGVLECRWTHGKQLRWIKVNSNKKKFTNAVSPVPMDKCRLQNKDATVTVTGRGSEFRVGFPVTNTDANGMFIDGVNEVLVMPVDFPDFPGGPGLQRQLRNDAKLMGEWFDHFSSGKSKFNITSHPTWFRMSKNRSEYPTDGKATSALQVDANAKQGNQAQAMIDEITKVVDLRKFSTIYIIYPDGELVLSDFIVRNHEFRIKEGRTHLNLFSWGYMLELMETQKWAYYIHETLHDFRLIGHAPGNGWPLGVMQNQSGISYAMNPYEQFLLDWLPEEQIYCADAANLATARVSLSPVEREDNQTKMALIRLSKTRILVVESHGIEKWSSFNFGDRSFPPGFYGVMAYVVDLNKVGAPPVRPDGTSLYSDDWAWAVWEKVRGVRSNEFNLTVGDRKVLGDYVAVLGDAFEVDGVRIKVVGTGDYETIEISGSSASR
jgi:hypothetical protein